MSFFNFRSDNRGSSGFGGGDRPTVVLTDHINKDNKDKTLVMKGMPFRATDDEVKEFFKDFELLTPDSVYIEQENGRKNGKGAVVFKNEDVAQDAKGALNKQEIGDHGRYVILCDMYDDFFQQTTNLYDD